MRKFVNRFRILKRLIRQNGDLSLRLDALQQAMGRIEARQVLAQPVQSDLTKYEFKVYSQWGEDGIIQYLIHHMPISKCIFVEFGVHTYREANTRFLLQHNNWSGLVMDSSEQCIQGIREDPISYLFDLQAVHAFIDKENINQLLKANGISGDIGLLSIDIDGNDYWVWEAIDVITPAIVVIEYNHRFGPDRSVVVPYDKQFNRSQAHYSMVYFGSSLTALCKLGKKKGYSFVGTNSHGANAFFVRSDMKPKAFNELTPAEGFHWGNFHEARDSRGQLSFLSLAEEQKLISQLPLEEV